MTDPHFVEQCHAAAILVQQGDASAQAELEAEICHDVRELTAETLRDIWGSFDVDGSGYLDAPEVTALLVEYLQTGTRAATEQIITLMADVLLGIVGRESMDDGGGAGGGGGGGGGGVDPEQMVRLYTQMLRPPLTEGMRKMFSELLDRAEDLSAALLEAMDVNHDGTVNACT